MDAIKLAERLIDEPTRDPPVGDLLRKPVDDLSPEEGESFNELCEYALAGFMKMAAVGEPFVPAGRIQEEFGKTLSQDYPEAGPAFLKLATTYWTFMVALEDLKAQVDTAAYGVLQSVEMKVGGLFFPNLEYTIIDPKKRAAVQRQILEVLIPEIDVDDFISHNPILIRARKAQGPLSGCLVAPLIFGEGLVKYLSSGGG